MKCHWNSAMGEEPCKNLKARTRSLITCRRKFRSQTSDNMDRWKSRSEKRREEKRRKGRESLRRKKIQVREKVGKSRNTLFFQWFVAPEGRKVGSLKRRVRSQLARWEMNNCTLLKREAHVEVKMYKTPQIRTFRNGDVEKVHAVVARSTFRSQKCKKLMGSDHFGSWDVENVHAVAARSTFRSQMLRRNTTCSDRFWKLRCRKSAHRCGAKHISKSKCWKKWSTTCSDHFLAFRCRFAWQARGIVHLVKSEQNVRVL